MRSTLSFSQLVNNSYPIYTRSNENKDVTIDGRKVSTAVRGESGDALILAPTKRTWLDSSPPTNRSQFVFPSNRSNSGSMPPLNGSASPDDDTVGPPEEEGIGRIDAMRKQLIRLNDSNMELRAHMKYLQTYTKNASTVRVTELEKLWRTRCTDLETALREEQRRSNEKDELIVALQEELTATKQTMKTMLTGNAPHGENTKRASKTPTGPRTFREVQRSLTSPNRAGTPLVQQAERAMSKVRRSHSNRVNTHVVLGRQFTKQEPSRGHGASKWIHSLDSHMPEGRQGSIREHVKKETDLSSCNFCHSTSPSSNIATLKSQQEPVPVAAAVGVTQSSSSSSSLFTPHTRTTGEVAAAAAVWNPQPSSSRSFAPQTLVDLYPSDSVTPPKMSAKSWYDEDEVREVVMSSRASRMRLAAYPRQLLRQD